ncbi:phosphate ABC transporter membrane protein 1, PhoT family [Methanocella conradii HZ254]|uniref:Phosphate transport system permease protein n=1 Tax=Methanocella conradii (strain DSM 24694 / JCM 17849 / CGMCC 1.5162 / HZ254) TaxID=1041930 RepID=H8I666_METCZ|nr:phosphate ABC transporter permease subunit PstC [Methanocella conradii]AFD00713.1 phosphate ABC transporter membrane protein 1, PhoT family [Methanocella conradii HZ254]MDI6896411.1 phosphate ABC transporter permease subunit PstC [Methanocella conradii]
MHVKEKIVQSSLFICALSSIAIILLIIFFIINEGLPAISRRGILDFILGGEWNATYSVYGILPMIVGTLAVTLLSLLISVPLGVGCAILLAEIAPPWARDIIKPAIGTLAGIPSVIYGFFGLVVIVPWIVAQFGGTGVSVLACGIVLAIMVLPTIISVSEDALRSVPREYREGAIAIGATPWQTVTGIVVPAASSGIVASIILAMGRAIGETMAVLMVGGSVVAIPDSIFSPVAPMTAVIALEFSYASGEHLSALYAIGIVLLLIIMLLNSVIHVMNSRRGMERA